MTQAYRGPQNKPYANNTRPYSAVRRHGLKTPEKDHIDNRN